MSVGKKYEKKYEFPDINQGKNGSGSERPLSEGGYLVSVGKNSQFLSINRAKMALVVRGHLVRGAT